MTLALRFRIGTGEMYYDISLDEVLELCEAADEVLNEEISPNNLLLASFWHPDDAHPAIASIRKHAEESEPQRSTQLRQPADLMVIARTLGSLQRKRLLAIHPRAEAIYGYPTWLQRALDTACIQAGDAPPLYPVAETLTRLISESGDTHNI